jgi:hypothetical protein
MAQAIVGLEEAAELIGRLKAAAEGNGRFPEVIMPNGKRLADCTFGYIGQLEEAMQMMGLQMPEPAASSQVLARRLPERSSVRPVVQLSRL